MYKLSWSWGKPLKIFLKIPKIKRKKEEWVGVVEAWVDLTKDRKYIDNCDIYRLQSFQIFLYLLVLCLCNVFWKGSIILSISSFYQDPCYFLYCSFLYELTMELLTYPIFQAPSKAKRSHLSPFPIFCCFPSFTPRKCHFSHVPDFISFR